MEVVHFNGESHAKIFQFVLISSKMRDPSWVFLCIVGFSLHGYPQRQGQRSFVLKESSSMQVQDCSDQLP